MDLDKNICAQDGCHIANALGSKYCSPHGIQALEDERIFKMLERKQAEERRSAPKGFRQPKTSKHRKQRR